MNARETMAFKAMLKRIAAEENVPAQVVLQNYMFERLMARLVKLPLRKNLILKGGLLVSHLLGLSRRTTMDMDVTLRNAEMSEATVRSWMERILSVDVRVCQCEWRNGGIIRKVAEDEEDGERI